MAIDQFTFLLSYFKKFLEGKSLDSNGMTQNILLDFLFSYS